MTASHPGPVIPERYREALGDDDPLLAMAEAPGRLRTLIRGLSEKHLAQRPAPGKWSIKEIVAHLADGEVVLGARYRFIAAHEKPVIQSYDQDAFVERLGVGNTTADELVADYELARAVNIGLLLRLPPESFDRVGVHEERGEESILTLATLYAGHDRVHLQQIETIRTGLFPRKRRTPSRAVARKAAAPARKKAPAARGGGRPKATKGPATSGRKAR